MYRNKILVIATVLIALLLGVMIWSANVVADHQAKQKDDNVIGVELPKEQLPPPVPSGPAETPDDEVAATVDEVLQSLSVRPLYEMVTNAFLVFGRSGYPAQCGKMFPYGFGVQTLWRKFLIVRCSSHAGDPCLSIDSCP